LSVYWLRVEQDTARLQVKRYHGQIIRISEETLLFINIETNKSG